MKTLGAQWLNRKGDLRSKTGWALQVVQDTLALETTMPLRLYDINVGKKIESAISRMKYNHSQKGEYSENEIVDIFKLIKNEIYMNEKIKYIINNNANSPWITKTSNSDFFIEKLASWKEWQYFQYIIMADVCSDCIDNINDIAIYICKNIIYYFALIETENRKIILVSGPKIHIPCETQGYICPIEDIKKFSVKFNNILNQIGAPSWVRPEQAELFLEINDQNYIKSNLNKCSKIIKMFLDAEIEDQIQEDVVLERKVAAKISRYALNRISSSGCEDDISICVNQQDHSNQLVISKKLKKWKVVRREREKLCDDISKLQDSSEDTEINFEQKRILYFYQKLKLFRSWMDCHFGIIAAEYKGKIGEIENSVAVKLASQVADLLLADLVSIFRCDYWCDEYGKVKSKLFTIASHYQGKNHIAGTERWLEKQRELMDEAANNEILRKNSISYRVIDRGKSSYCSFYDPDTGVSHPRDEKILRVNSEIYECSKSGIAVPIIINGKIFGVLEATGLCECQFDESDIHYASLLADEIGRSLYQYHVSQHINYVIKKTSVISENKKLEKYNTLCEAACKIFISPACTLWKFDDKYEKCNVIGWFNRKDLPDIYQDEKCVCELDDPSSPMMKTIEHLRDHPEDYCCCYNVNELREKYPDKWNIEHLEKIKPQRTWILDNNITSIVLIPLYPWEKKEERGRYFPYILYLYYSDETSYKDSFEKSWNTTIKFVAHNFGLHLEVIDLEKIANDLLKKVFSKKTEKEKLERDIRLLEQELDEKISFQSRKSIIEHDIKSQIPLLIETVANILHDIEINKYKIKKYKIKKWIDELKFYNHKTNYLLKLLSDDDILLQTPSNGDIGFNVEYLRGKEIKLKRINIKDVFNIAVEKEWKRRDITINMSGEVWAAIRIAEEHLNSILSNVLQNAVKYAIAKSEVSVRGYFDRFRNFFLSISNYTELLKDIDDITRLTIPGVRGHHAINGSGIGLHLVAGYCSFYSIGFDIDYEKTELHGRSCGKFTANLLFPFELITAKRVLL